MAQYWLRLQDIIILLSEINIVNEELMKISDNIHAWEDIAYFLLSDKPIETDMERTQNFQNSNINFVHEEVTVHKYSNDMKVIFWCVGMLMRFCLELLNEKITYFLCILLYIRPSVSSMYKTVSVL